MFRLKSRRILSSTFYLLKAIRTQVIELFSKWYFQAKESENLDHAAGSIQGRVQRVHDVVMADMDNYEPDWYTDKVNSI